ncbi:MAG: pyridoxine 5'-phosphate synthase [Bacteroidetes bacterium]|nr:pyridoxine 5'-phosphate synthase [Bacteroidota bacterium]
MTRLSVNLNKIGTIRNARGGNIPDLIQIGIDCEKYGAEGITVHPRLDERHIRFEDVRKLKQVITTELNIEGYPSRKWLDLLLEIKPEQATLVPDDPDQITSDHGWDTVSQPDILKDVIDELKTIGCRVSLFIDPVNEMIDAAAELGVNRIELYTGPYALGYEQNREDALSAYKTSAERAREKGLGINAGHDLSLVNLQYLHDNIPFIDEVSIGHALISDALYYGLENTIQLYLRKLQ